MSSPPDVLKLDARVEVNGRPLTVSVHVQGEGEYAHRAAAELSATVAAILSGASEPAQLPTAQEGATSVSKAQPPATVAQAARVGIEAAKERPGGGRVSPADPSPGRPAPSLVLRAQRHRAKINLAVGGVLLALAVLVPAVVPADQRREVLIMTILFGLTGALMLFTATLPGHGQSPMADERVTVRLSPADRAQAMMRLRASARRRTPMKAGWGMGLGVAFVLLGVLAPFTLGATTADERFVIMLGFAPIAVVGFFLIVIFGRGVVFRAAPQPVAVPAKPAAPAPKRPPVARVPQTFEYRAVVPATIITLLVVMIVVIGVVIYATAASAVR